MVHVLERKLDRRIVAFKEAAEAVSCGFAAPTCALHNLYPLSEGLRRLLTDGQTATAECMVPPEEGHDDARRRKLRASGSNVAAKAGSAGVDIAADQDVYRPEEPEKGRCSLWKSFTLELTREEYQEKCAALFNRGVAPVTRLLDTLDVGVDEIDEVVMVGGMTRTPRVRELLMSHLGVNRLNIEIDPDIVVAYGAATIAY